MEDADLDAEIQEAYIKDLDAEQVELGSSSTFWTLINERREQPTMSRAELEQASSLREQG